MNSVDEYIKQFPPETQSRLRDIRALIHKIAPDAVESISYGLAGYKLHGKPLAYFGGWEKHIGFYPTPSGTTTFEKELSKYKGGKGSVQLPLDQPLPIELIEKIVRFRMQEILGK